LFVFVDFILGTDIPKQDLPEIDQFIKSVLRLTVVWLRKIP